MNSNELVKELDIELDNTKKSLAVEFIKTNLDKEEDIQRVIDGLDEMRKSSISEPLYQSGKTDSDTFNKQFKDFLSDLALLFAYANKTAESISNQNKMEKQFINKLKSGLSKIQEKIEAYKYIANNKEGFTEINYENFSNRNSFESYKAVDEIIFNNPKANTVFNEDYICDLNQKTGGLTLHNVNKLLPKAPVPEVLEQTGRNLKAKGKSYPMVNMVEHDNPNDVWSETILTDKELEVPTSNIDKGAVCKFRIILQQTMPINHISINPFSKHPIKIHQINTYKSIEEYSKGNDYAENILSDKLDTQYNPQYLNDQLTLEFPTKQCQVIEFLVNQEHYELEQYTISEQHINDIDLTEKFYKNNKTNITIPEDSEIQSTLELDYANSNIVWDYFQKLINRFFSQLDVNNKDNIIRSLLNSISYIIPELNSKNYNGILNSREEGQDDKLININKFEYQYGFESILPSYKEYKDKSIYVSKPMYFKDNVKEVSLVADDYNPSYENSGNKLPATSIEYYVTNRKDPMPTNADWHPILPENYKHHDYNGNKIINGERLTPLRNLDHLVAKIRFPAIIDSIEVYKNGELIKNEVNYYDNSSPYIYHEGQSDEKTINDYVISIPDEQNNLLNNIYTVSYTISPTDENGNNFDPTIVDFESVTEPISYIDEDGTYGEKFEFGTDKNNSIHLSNYPYIDRSKLNDDSNKVNTGISTNPLENQYSPNYGDGYMPIKIDGVGKAEYSAVNSTEVKTHEGEIKQDRSGVPFRYMTYQKDDTTGENEPVEKYNPDYTVPYFRNRTNYSGFTSPALQEYDPIEYPVFEYLQFGKDIYLNDTLNEIGSKNQAEINVKYKFLVECVRLKIVMYRNTPYDNGLTPVVYDYALKTRPFKQFY